MNLGGLHGGDTLAISDKMLGIGANNRSTASSGVNSSTSERITKSG